MTLLFIIFALLTGMACGLFFAGVRNQAVPLSDAQIDALWAQCANGKSFEATVRAVERAHNII